MSTEAKLSKELLLMARADGAELFSNSATVDFNARPVARPPQGIQGSEFQNQETGRATADDPTRAFSPPAVETRWRLCSRG